LKASGYQHEVTYLKGNKKAASELLPRVRLVISYLKRWMMGTHQGAVSHKHFDYYLRKLCTSPNTAFCLDKMISRG
jgi:hypothetical protein